MINKTPKRSIVGGEPFGYHAKQFGKYIIISAGAMSAFITIFRLYEMPKSQMEFYTRVIPLTVAVLIFTAAFFSANKYAVDYRRRFRTERERAMVRDLYPDRSYLRANYKKVILCAQSKIVVIGISLHTLTTEPNFPKWIHQALSTNKNLHIYLYFLKPRSNAVFQKEREEGRPPGRISMDCQKNIHRAIRLKSELGVFEERFHVLIGDRLWPIAFVMQRDEEIYFEPYLSQEIGRTCPTFVLAKNQQNEVVLEEFFRHIDTVLDSATEITNLRPLRHIRLPYADTIDRSNLRNAIFLDRDGVLIKDCGYISQPNQVELLPGVVDALELLSHNFRLIVVTNQSGVARGYFEEESIAEINECMISLLEERGLGFDGIYYCPHHPDVGEPEYRINCDCRKPKPGLILAAAEDFDLDFKNSFIVGDKESDVGAGVAAGLHTVRIFSTTNEKSMGDADEVVPSLIEAAHYIIGRSST